MTVRWPFSRARSVAFPWRSSIGRAFAAERNARLPDGDSGGTSERRKTVATAARRTAKEIVRNGRVRTRSRNPEPSASRRAGFPSRALEAAAPCGSRLTDPEDADPAQRVVEPDRICGVESGEPVRDLPRCSPVRGAAARQPESPGHEVNVRVGRYDEAGRGDLG